MSDYRYFTLIFEGDIRSFKGNPFKTETAFGVPLAVSIGDVVAENDELRDRLEKALADRPPSRGGGR